MKDKYKFLLHKIFKIPISLIALMLVSQISYSQAWEWAKHFSGAAQIRVNSHSYSEFDSSITAVVAFSGTMALGGDNFTSDGGVDILVANFTSGGDLQWTSQIGSVGTESPKDVYTDVQGNIFVTGSFSDVVNVDGNVIVATDAEDVFLAKYEPDGTVDWLRNIGWGPGVDRGSNIAIDQYNNIYIVGFYNDTIIFGTDSLFSNGFTNNFVLKLNSSGDYLTSINYQGTNNNTRLNSISVAYDTTKLVSGFFLDRLIFPNNDTLTSNGQGDFVMFKLGENDGLQWIRQIGGPGEDIGYDAKADEFGSIYVIGQMAGTIQVDSSGQEIFDGSPITSNGGTDILTAKYNKQGRLLWKKNIGGKGDDLGRGIEINQNLIHFSGHISDTVIIGFDTLATTGLTDNDACFGVYNSSGNFITMEKVKGSGIDRALNIAYDNRGGEFIGGFFRSPELYIGDDTLTNASGSSREGFLAKWQSKFSISITQQTNVTCNGDNDGQLIVTPYFGSPPYNYLWSHDPGLNDSTADNLTAGIYKIVVTDIDLKKDSLNIEITQPDPIAITLDSTNLSCYESGDGAIDIEVTGGTGGYSYNWTGGSGLNPTGSDQSNLYAGLYKVTVTDNSLCQANDSVTVAEPDPITFAGTIVTPAYSTDSCTGSIDLEVQGGTPGYSYEWEKGGFPMPGRTSDTLNNLCGDTYIVTVTDSHTCAEDTTIVVTAIDELVVYIDSLAHVKCNGDNNGYARVGITGDLGFDFSYHWEDSGGSTVGSDTNYIANVSGGIYYITVTENGGDNRTDSTSVEIEEPDVLTTQIDSIPPLCYGDVNGSINLTVSGGKPLYTYLWSSGQTTEDLSNIPGSAEYYRVTVTDNNGCQAIDSVYLPEPLQLIVNIETLQVLRCNGYTNGILRASVSGGTGDIDYLWNDPGGQATQIATGLEAGNYTVTVTDENICQDTASRTLIDPDPITIAQVDTTHVSCKGFSDGSILVTPAGGTLPYTYDWDRVPLDTNYITGLSSAFGGLYSVTVTDFYGCPPAEATIQIKEPAIALNVMEDPAYHEDNLCFGYSNGELGVAAEGGWGNYEYSLNNIDWNTETLFTELSSGSYYIKVRDNLLCRDSVLISINEPAEIILEEVTSSHQNVLCFGGSTGNLEVTASGGTPGYEYSMDKLAWNPDPVFDNLTASDYNIWVRDTNECYDSILISITEAPDIVLQEISASHENVLCFGDSTGQIQVSASGGTPGYEYSNNKTIWNLSPVFENLPAGDLTFWVRDANACTDSADFTITQPDKILIDPAVSTDTLQVEASGGIPPYEYSVDGSSYVSTGFFPGLAEGEHAVIVIDDNSCTADTIILIDTIPGTGTLPVTIYDAFSPNADGKNEVWNIGNIDSFPECEVKIYNTWGKLVFSSSGYPEPWDGKHDGRELPAGTYYYIIDLGDGSEAYTGTVNIVK